MDDLSDIVPKQFFASWFADNGREFPWRGEDVSAFQLLVTEMLLRQTRAAQVARLWNDFINRFGTPRELASADRAKLFSCIEELGFGNQRVDALRSAARHIIENHDGQVPNGKSSLLEIPHVGSYTAHAVLCFAHGRRVAIVDTNILRLFCRLLGKEVNRLDIRREPWAWEAARSLLPEEVDRTRSHNYGLLDFTAAVCKPRSPQCEECPLTDSCHYARRMEMEKEVTGLP